MSKIAITPNASGTGTFTIAAPNSNTDRTLTLPDAAGAVVIDEAGGGSVKIDNSGNVGIGTSSPSFPMHVSTSTFPGVGIFRALDVGTIGAASQEIQIGALDGSTPTPGASIIGVLNNPATTGTLSFQTRYGGALSERMRIDSAGYVTMPNQPAWHYVGGTALSQNLWTTIVPSAAVISSSNYNTSTGAFTAPVAGKYYFGVWGLIYPNGVDTLTYGVFKNGATVGNQVQRGGNSQNHTMITVGLIVNCAASDYIDFRVFTTASGITAYSGQWNQFGYLIG